MFHPRCNVNLFRTLRVQVAKMLSFVTALLLPVWGVADPAPEVVTQMFREGGKPSLSGDGRWLAYECNGRKAFCITDTVSGVSEVAVSVSNQNHILQHIDISRDGNFVAYWLRAGTNMDEEIHVYNRLTQEDEIVSVNSEGEPGQIRGGLEVASLYSEPHISGDGRFVVFSSRAHNLVPEDTNDREDVFVRDRLQNTTTRVSVSSAGTEGDDKSSGWGNPPFISDSGQYVAFISYAENLVPNDSTDDQPPYEFENLDVFIYDTVNSQISRISEEHDSPFGGSDDSKSPILSPDGNVVAFSTFAHNLYSGPYAQSEDLIFREREGGAFKLVNRPVSGVPQYDGTKKSGDYNFDGSILYFRSLLSNLVTDEDDEFSIDVFAYQNGEIKRLRPNIAGAPGSIDYPSSNDTGSIVAFQARVQTESGTETQIGIFNRGDVTPPRIFSYAIIPEGPIPQGSIVDITGFASDIGRGNTDIKSAEYRINDGDWQPLPAKDGSFDDEHEEVRAFLAADVLEPGMYTVCARATDMADNVGVEQCEEVEIVQSTGESTDFHVECTHSPLWPQPGDTVEIIARTLNFAGTTSAGIPPANVDRLEVWFENVEAPESVREAQGVSYHTFVTPVLEGEDFSYGCRAIVQDKALFTGWRTVAVGTPDDGAIPVMYTGPSSDRIDIVFVADEDSYTDASDPSFLADVEDYIKFGFLRFPLYNENQHLVNFWLAQTTGAADRKSSGEACEVTKPTDWVQNYSFSDSGVIVHTDRFRDCARSGMVTSEPGDYDTFRHELGHRPFGLGDEYCCDTSYYISTPFSNLYETEEDCVEDAPNLGRTGESCREMTSSKNDKTVFVSDPDSGDLMVDNQDPNASDVRRIEWLFDRCLEGKC